MNRANGNYFVMILLLHLLQMRALAMEKIAVLMGKEVLSVVPGRVSTEVDARCGWIVSFSFTITHFPVLLFLFF